MIHVCDSIMGGGKTSAAITYINEHPEKRFLYLTPYLDEARRILDGCPEANFAEPDNKNWEFKFSKVNHTLDLLHKGRNVASTHQAMMYYTKETLDAIREFGYTVIIDEAISVLERDQRLTSDDIDMMVWLGILEETAPGMYSRTGKPYNGILNSVINLPMVRSIIKVDGSTSNAWYWTISKDMLEAFSDGIILTYLFKGSELEQFLRVRNIDYDYIGVEKRDDGTYAFTDGPSYIPEYVYHLGDMIDICDREKLNRIGKDKNALSMHWFEMAKNANDIKQLKNHIYNYFNNINDDVPAPYRMCGTFKDYWPKIKGKGYGSEKVNCVVHTQRSSNRWADHTVLAYPVNVFPNPNTKRIYQRLGGDIDEDRYALSTMIQWVWRSAIRNGENIRIYIPSKRMRTLFTNWIEDVSRGGARAE